MIQLQREMVNVLNGRGEFQISNNRNPGDLSKLDRIIAEVGMETDDGTIARGPATENRLIEEDKETLAEIKANHEDPQEDFGEGVEPGDVDEAA